MNKNETKSQKHDIRYSCNKSKIFTKKTSVSSSAIISNFWHYLLTLAVPDGRPAEEETGPPGALPGIGGPGFLEALLLDEDPDCGGALEDEGGTAAPGLELPEDEPFIFGGPAEVEGGFADELDVPVLPGIVA